MKLLRFALPVMSASIPAIVLVTGQVISACGGSSNTSNNGNGNGNGSNDSGSTTSTNGGQDSSTSSSGGQDGSTGSQGGEDAGGSTGIGFDAAGLIPDGGITIPQAEAGSLGAILPLEAGVIGCGPTACAIDNNTCCGYTDGGTDCVTSSTATCSQGTLHCAQAADCSGGDICCVNSGFSGGSVTLTSSCAATCPTTSSFPPGAQMCSTDAECTNKEKCTLQSCGGETVKLCGLFSYSGIVNVTCTAE